MKRNVLAMQELGTGFVRQDQNRRDKTVKKMLFCILATSLVLFVACSQAAPAAPTAAKPAAAAPTVAAPAPAAPTAAKPAAAAPAKVVKFGMNASMSGGSAQYGFAMARPAEIAIEKVNSSGGLTLDGQKYTIQLVNYDHAFDAAKSVENANRLFTADKVDFYLPQGGAAALPTFPIAAKAGILTIAAVPSSMYLKPEFPLIYGSLVGTREKALTLYQYAADAYKVKSVFVFNPDDESGWQSTKDSVEVATKAGLTVNKEFYPRGTNDFYPLLSRILPLNPDLIELGVGPATEAANFVKQARERGYKGRFGTVIATGQPIIQTAGADKAEGLIITAGTWPTDSPLLTKEEQFVRDEWIKKWGPPFEATSWSFGGATDLLIDGLRKAGSIDKDKVKKALETQTLDLWGRAVRFGGASVYGAPRMLVTPLPILEVKGGKMESVKVVDLPKDY